MTYTANYTVETTAKSFAIVAHLRHHGPTGVSELSDELGVPKSIVHNHVSTLRELGYVRKRDGAYRLSLQFLETGVAVRSQSALFHRMEHRVNAVARQFDAVAFLLERDGATGVVTHVADGGGVDAAFDLGERLEPTAAPLGVALLGELPVADRDAILNECDDDEPALDALDRTVFIDTPKGSSSPIAAVGVEVDGDVGSVGVQLPHGIGSDGEGEVRDTLTSLSVVPTPEGERRRSFATAKHSWLGE
ncbi:helix-turn-helix domain-containing protein [Halarchaeum nitratireducens]|uniref:HTH iclR-type domain-containing protein n=1 Tax=Halarchaeum nitratireducens TaxID=489913 RepID=A0A830GFM5_9EURY|nr:helix-turn-helix domain-containing protein [Halarchaeum nitratireducens]GGN24467.1 hypothetical protein GCM10009021_27840 [Halarchaeum nitratireducens]